jgi:hypothetical protein
MSEFTCPSCGTVLTVSAKNAEPVKAWTVEAVRTLFPEELEKLLTFQEQTDSILLKPKRFLGSEHFSRIAHIVRVNKGEYISQGKQSHFIIGK